MKLYLIRHAAVNVRADLPGPQWRLSPEGRAAAEVLGEEPHWAELQLLCTSPEPKAAGTAQRIAARHGLPIRIEPDLREVEGRAWVGGAEYRIIAQRYLAGEPVEGWEARATALNRLRTCVKSISDGPGYSKVGVVSHGLILTIYLADLLDLDTETTYKLWSRLRFPDVAAVDPVAKQVLREFGT